MLAGFVDVARKICGSQQLGATPLGRFGHADDVAAAVVYLAGDGAGFITGTTLDLNGGRSMR